MQHGTRSEAEHNFRQRDDHEDKEQHWSRSTSYHGMVLDSLVHSRTVLGCILGVEGVCGKETQGLSSREQSQEKEKEAD